MIPERLFRQIFLAVLIFWGFDGTLQDLYNNFNGQGSNGTTYNSPGYNGAGSCLWLTRSSAQSVIITTPPFLNMAYTLFTFELWIYAQTPCNNHPYTDNAIFGQYQQNSTDQSLYISVRNQRTYFGFSFDDAIGSQVSKCQRNLIKIDIISS